jgi:hypothetical protein
MAAIVISSSKQTGTANMTEEQLNSHNLIQYSKEEFYKARNEGKSWAEALQLARESYNMTDAEYEQMLHQLH